MNVIDRAADRLRGHWCKGKLRDNNGNVCMVGALKAVTETPDHDLISDHALPAIQAIEHVIATEYGNYGLPSFNDLDWTTEEDVLLVFKKASALLDERAS